jgi:hypothetical protein
VKKKNIKQVEGMNQGAIQGPKGAPQDRKGVESQEKYKATRNKVARFEELDHGGDDYVHEGQ